MAEEYVQFACMRCGTVFRIAPGRVGAAGRIARCNVCSHEFVVKPLDETPPEYAEEGAGVEAEPLDEAAAEGISFAEEEEADFGDIEVGDEPGGVLEIGGPEEPDAGEPEGLGIEVGGLAGEALEIGGAEEEAVALDVESTDLAADDSLAFAEAVAPSLAVDEEAAEEAGAALEEGEEGGEEVFAEVAGDEEPFVEFELPSAGEEDGADFGAAEEEVPAREAGPGDTQIRQRYIPPDIEMPGDTRPTARLDRPIGDVEMPEHRKEEIPDYLATQRRWRDPMRAEKKRRKGLLGSGAEGVSPGSGILYKAIILLAGLLGLTTSFLGIEALRIDPVWSVSFIAIGVLSFFLQSMSGLLIAGLFSFFYPLSLFATQKWAFEYGGDLTGIQLLAAEAGLALAILVIYFILMARKGALFVIKEGRGQSITALVLGIVTLLVAVWAFLDSRVLIAMGKISIAGNELANVHYYSYAGFPTLVLACALSLSVATGFSARAVRNRLMLLANAGLALGFLALIFIYIQFQVLPEPLAFSIGF